MSNEVIAGLLEVTGRLEERLSQLEAQVAAQKETIERQELIINALIIRTFSLARQAVTDDRKAYLLLEHFLNEKPEDDFLPSWKKLEAKWGIEPPFKKRR